ncbi:MAG TPA: thioredoxin domain-containing protein [Chitinophagaceae bacterium]
MPLRPPVSSADHIQGNDNALIELVEYGDYQCPHCGRAYPIVKQLQEELGNQLKFIFRNFPLAKIHPEATLAAIATEAAALQGSYWEMHDIVFENQDDLGKGALLQYAVTLGLDVTQLEEDMARPELASKVEADFESGIRSGVNATPTFFINGEKYNNGWEGDRMLTYIRANYPGL